MDTCQQLRNNRRRAQGARTECQCNSRRTRKDWAIDPLLFYLGLALCLLAASRVALLSIAGWRRLRARQRGYEAEKLAFAQQVQTVVRQKRADAASHLAWSGTRDLRIAAIVDEAVDVKSIYLSDPAGGLLPRFEPGQYLTCHFDTAAGERPLVRCYSLSDRPQDEYYRLTVKRCLPPAEAPAAPAGRGSSRLHAMQVGDVLPVSAPRGGFFLDRTRKHPLVFIAAGIGVTPIVSMLAELAASDDPRLAYLFYGVRNSEHHVFRDQIQQLAEACPQLHMFVAYSQPLATDLEQHDYRHGGHLTVDYIQNALPPGLYDYYLCGPGGMMESMVEGLLADGVTEDRILYEAFGPASIRRTPAAPLPRLAASGPPPTVRFASSQQQVDWDDQCESLLDLMEGIGVAIDSGCRAGNCGMCAARVLEGDIATVKQPGASTPDGYCLACISVPRSPVVLEL